MTAAYHVKYGDRAQGIQSHTHTTYF